VSLKLGVIGYGNIAKAIIIPLLEKKILNPDQIFCLVKSKKSYENIKNTFEYKINISYLGSPESNIVWDCPFKLLSVKPQQLKDIKEKNFNSKKKDILISVIAGISINKLQNIFPNHSCIRAITNIPITIGHGLTGISWSDNIDQNEKNFVRSIFQSSSKVYEFTEEFLDIFLALTSSAPAIIALIIESLGDGGLSGGLSKKLSEELVLDMILGTVMMLKKSNISTSDLKNMVTSPGGTTISALRVLEKKCVRSALLESIMAAMKKSKEFG